MTTHEALVEGRNRLDAGRHLKRRLTNFRDGVCARGAYCAPNAALHPCDRALGRVLGVESEDPHVNAVAIVEFNNAPSTTKEDVLALFDKAIAQTAPEPDTEFLNNVADPVAA